ncbi:hypothetical protein [Sphingomonas sp. URHD0057]|uniref:hypothetical protein n=1 Tax=Sphingomonas sp. URHD0057 TaxID=1380389 RepID=UPI00048C6D04|nr:hypothetical protein [Sphingomonas sp. URHD0057]
MKFYHVYSVDPQGSITGDRTIRANSDDDAIFEVRAMQRALETQIWDKDRRVARIPAHQG